jgi:hypothetical protein
LEALKRRLAENQKCVPDVFELDPGVLGGNAPGLRNDRVELVSSVRHRLEELRRGDAERFGETPHALGECRLPARKRRAGGATDARLAKERTQG